MAPGSGSTPAPLALRAPWSRARGGGAVKGEGRWGGERRKEVRGFLAGESVRHGRIGSWPAWHVEPYVSVWAVESLARPGWVGWWVICGDLPTDYVSSARIKHPRTALRAFAKRWLAVANCMRRGRAHPTVQLERARCGRNLSRCCGPVRGCLPGVRMMITRGSNSSLTTACRCSKC